MSLDEHIEVIAENIHLFLPMPCFLPELKDVTRATLPDAVNAAFDDFTQVIKQADNPISELFALRRSAKYLLHRFLADTLISLPVNDKDDILKAVETFRQSYLSLISDDEFMAKACALSSSIQQPMSLPLWKEQFVLLIAQIKKGGMKYDGNKRQVDAQIV